MTHNGFAVHATSPRVPHHARPAYARSGAIGFRIVRLVWLTARFARRDLVTIDEYRERFGTSLRSSTFANGHPERLPSRTRWLAA